MELEKARKLAEQAKAKRDENPGHTPTQEELRAIDMVLVDQARQQLAQSKG